MNVPMALDLFCGEGGATRGLQLAGFHVTGVDIRPMRRYCGDEFVQADALAPPFDLAGFDFIWASPPCERYSCVWNGRDARREVYPDLIEPVRRMLASSGIPHVIENVVGAPLRSDLVLTGAMFGLPIVRNRVLEVHGWTAPFLLSPQHTGTVSRGDLACVVGHGIQGVGRNGWNRRNWERPEIRAKLRRINSIAGWREAMEMPWASRDGIRKAVPPAYADFIGRAFLERAEAAAA